MNGLIRQFTRFTGVGFASATGHYGLLIGLVQLAGISPVAASAAGALLGAAINYSLNYRFTFNSSKRHRESALKFLTVAGVGLALNTLFMWVGVALLGIHYMVSQVFTTGLVLLWSFFANRNWTFHVLSTME
ncbi:MAG: GtrA family protein [Sulfuricella sp.]